MENQEIVHRSITWYLWKCNKNATEIHDELQRVCGDSVKSLRTIQAWVSEFKQGKNSPFPGTSSGRPSSSTNEVNIDQIQSLVTEDRRITIKEISEHIGISYGSVSGILHESLHLSKLACRWIPKLLTVEMKEKRVQVCQDLLSRYNEEGPEMMDRIVTGDEKWFYYHDPASKQESREWRNVGSPPPLKVNTARSAGKRMASVFWDRKGILLIDWLPQNHSINAQYYCQLLLNLKEKIKQERRGKLSKGVLLLHDNARPHTANQTQTTLQAIKFESLPHPPYSPDLAPSDYWLFAEMAKEARGHKWSNIQELSGALGRWAKATQKEWYAKGIDQLPIRWQRAISLRGDYIEAMQDSETDD